MRDYMEELSAAWVVWARHRDSVRDKVVELVRQTDAQFHDDEDRRQSEMKRLQRGFYRVAIAEKLLESKKFDALTPLALLDRANAILAKKGYRPGMRGRSSDVRTPAEQEYCNTVRVRWHYLLKRAGVEAADNRGRR